MARVNHKLVKQRLNEKRSKVTDRQFFTSRLLAGYFEDLAAAQTKRYHYNRRVKVSLFWKAKDPFFAATNDCVIRINAGFPFVTKVKGRENRFNVITGVFAHELGHVLYTDFLLGQTYMNALSSLRWYPVKPILKDSGDNRREKAFWDYINDDPSHLLIVKEVAKKIENVIEDGYIENRMLINFPGKLGFGLQTLRDIHFQDMPTVTELIEKEEEDSHIFCTILQIVLSYAKFGEIKYGEEPLTDKRIKMVFGLIDVIDEALYSSSMKDRWNATNQIMIRCWDYLQEYCEKCKEQIQNEIASGNAASMSDGISDILKTISGGTSIGEGSSVSVSEDASKANLSATAAARAGTHAQAVGSQTENESDNTEETTSDTEGDKLLPHGCSASSGKQQVESGEGGRIPLEQTEDMSVPTGGAVEHNSTYQRESYRDAASDIERILEKMAEKEVCKELENDRIKELNDAAQSISYGDIHRGVSIRVNRIASVDEELVEQYEAISAPLLTISRQLQRSLVKQLAEKRRGGKMTGLLMGQRLDTHALFRNDGKVFYKNSLPNEIPELTVGLLLDESGSMGSCDRSTYARAAAIILYDFCEHLGIPVMIYGHSTGYQDSKDYVELFSYAEFEGFDEDDKYRLMDIGARGSNRDGAALRYVAECLSKRPEQVKLLILVSDGQPADTGYYGTAAEEDLRGIKQEYKRKGIIFVAAAIGNDKLNIERIYGDSFLDITDLNELPTKLTAVVKRHVRV